MQYGVEWKNTISGMEKRSKTKECRLKKWYYGIR